MKSEHINELASALSKAQGEMELAQKTNENPFFKSSYADLAECWNVCRAPLSKNGLCVVQTIDQTDKGTVLETLLAHSSGQWISGHQYIVPVKNDPQGVGAAITYARRYGLMAIVGIAPCDEDDDGNAAASRGKPAPVKPLAPKPKPEEVPSHVKGVFAAANKIGFTDGHIKSLVILHFPEVKSRKDLTNQQCAKLVNLLQNHEEMKLFRAQYDANVAEAAEYEKGKAAQPTRLKEAIGAKP